MSLCFVLFCSIDWRTLEHPHPAEVYALLQLDHLNIAKLFEALLRVVLDVFLRRECDISHPMACWERLTRTMDP